MYAAKATLTLCEDRRENGRNSEEVNTGKRNMRQIVENVCRPGNTLVVHCVPWVEEACGKCFRFW